MQEAKNSQRGLTGIPGNEEKDLGLSTFGKQSAYTNQLEFMSSPPPPAAAHSSAPLLEKQTSERSGPVTLMPMHKNEEMSSQVWLRRLQDACALWDFFPQVFHFIKYIKGLHKTFPSKLKCFRINVGSGSLGACCYSLNVCVTSKFYVEILISKVMVLGSGTFGRCLGHEDRVLTIEISTLIKEIPKS